MHIHSIDRNKNPLQISGKVAGGVCEDSKLLRAPIYWAHRVVVFAIARLSCFCCRRRQFHVLYLAIVELLLVLLELLYVAILSLSLCKNTSLCIWCAMLTCCKNYQHIYGTEVHTAESSSSHIPTRLQFIFIK